MAHPEESSSKQPDLTVDQTTGYLNELARDGLLHEALRYRVNRVVEEYGLARADREELQQGLWVEFAKAFKRFDPSHSTPSTYARKVADLWLRDRARYFSQEGRRRVLNAEEWSPEHTDTRRSDDDGAAQDAWYDFESICSLLEPDDAELLSELRYFTEAEVAERRGVNRGTVYRKRDRIYEFLRSRAEYFEK